MLLHTHTQTQVCADQLCKLLDYIFSLSLSQYKIPAMWKTSGACQDLRPIALTSHIMKCFERFVVVNLSRLVCAFQDPLQFAYRKGVNVDDALLFLLHRIYSHLELTGASVRIMLFRLSSTFHTIQPHISGNKLLILT